MIKVFFILQVIYNEKYETIIQYLSNICLVICSNLNPTDSVLFESGEILQKFIALNVS